MEIIRKILPYLFVLFFIIKANKNSLYLLGIPFLMFMSNSIFFENAKIFNIPGRYQAQLGFLWLLPLWIFSKTITTNNIKKLTKGTKLNIIEYLIIILMLITVIGLGTTITTYYPKIENILWEFLTYFSIFLGYFIIKDWFSSNEVELVLNFLYHIVFISSIASLFYILHQGLHFTLYIGKEYSSESFQGSQITRTFWFMPRYFFFSVIYLLVFKVKDSIIAKVLLLINLIAILITYTLSSIAIAIIIFIMYFIVKGIKEGKLGSAIKNLIIYAIAGIFGIFIMIKLLPANMNYLISRITEHTGSDYTDREPNDMDVRLINTLEVISKMAPDERMLGVGPVTESQSSKILEMNQNTADTVYSGIILRWGFIGLTIFILIYLMSTLQAFHLFMTSKGVLSDLSLMLFLYIISQFIEGFVSWTFLSKSGVTTGLWYFALLSCIPIFKKYEKSLVKKNERAKEYEFA